MRNHRQLDLEKRPDHRYQITHRHTSLRSSIFYGSIERAIIIAHLILPTGELSDAMRRVLAAQHLLIELPDAGLGDGVDEDDVIGEPPFSDARAQVVQDILFGELPGEVRFGNHAGDGSLIPLRMWHADHAGFQHLWMTHYQPFQLD